MFELFLVFSSFPRFLFNATRGIHLHAAASWSEELFLRLLDFVTPWNGLLLVDMSSSNISLFMFQVYFPKYSCLVRVPVIRL